MKLPLVRVTLTLAQGISLGRSQRGLTPQPLLPLHRRTSGGGAVLVGPWLLRALVVLPAGHEQVRAGPAAAARWLGEIHRGWLLRHAIDAAVYTGPTVGHWACFAGRTAGELMVDGRKITGISQTWRRKRALLWSATLLAPPPWLVLCAAMGRPLDESNVLEALTISARDCLGCEVDAGAWAASLGEDLALGTRAVDG